MFLLSLHTLVVYVNCSMRQDICTIGFCNSIIDHYMFEELVELQINTVEKNVIFK